VAVKVPNTENNIQVHERLATVETEVRSVKEIVTETRDRLLERGGVIETVNRHRTYWKIVGRILIIGSPIAAGALAYALRS